MQVIQTIATWVILAVCLFFQLNLSAKADGYGDFRAYMVGLADNELVAVRSEPKKGRNKIGSIFGNAENIYVHWCDKYDHVLWCDVAYENLRGWIPGENLQNVEGG